MRRIAFFILLLLLMSALSPSLAYAGNGASDVEITPKISITGSKGKGKPAAQVATGVLGDSPPPEGRRWAVIIGISDYAGEENDLQYSDDDALDMLEALTTVYGYKRKNIRLLISDYAVNNATYDKIIGAINWLKEKEGAGDEVVFFYSGHGARGLKADADKEVIDEGIVPYECTAESIIWDGNLASMFSGFDAARIILIFDSCYAGGMTDLKAEGRIIVMASTETGVSYESSSLENGLFTYYFVEKGMLQGFANTYDYSEVEGDEPATMEEAFDYAKAEVAAVAPQTPTISDSFKNDLLL